VTRRPSSRTAEHAGRWRVRGCRGSTQASNLNVTPVCTLLGLVQCHEGRTTSTCTPSVPPCGLSPPGLSTCHHESVPVGSHGSWKRPCLQSAHMILRVELVGSHGSWKRPCLQSAHMILRVYQWAHTGRSWKRPCLQSAHMILRVYQWAHTGVGNAPAFNQPT
jgi:hypothetical protein